ncbi:zinc finger BED domain-containing protein RICESLEEPER 2 [Tanacetum coccineum]
MAHILNLVVKDGLKAYKKEVDTIALAVKYIKHSSQRVTNFKESVENACTSNKFLISECPTRWNSTHDMLKTAIELKDAFFDYDFNNSCFARDLEEIPKRADFESKISIVSRMAKDILSIQVSSVASEYAFSASGRILDPYRNSLAPNIVEALVSTQDWICTSSKNITMDTLEDLMKDDELAKEIQEGLDQQNEKGENVAA